MLLSTQPDGGPDVASGAIDVCDYDASWGGGPTEWRCVAALASAFDGQFALPDRPGLGWVLDRAFNECHRVDR